MNSMSSGHVFWMRVRHSQTLVKICGSIARDEKIITSDKEKTQGCVRASLLVLEVLGDLGVLGVCLCRCLQSVKSQGKR